MYTQNNNHNMTTELKQSKQDHENNHNDKKSDTYIETPWKIIESYFNGKHLMRLVGHQIESYNNFISFQIYKTIEMFNPVRIVSEQDYDPKSQNYSLEIIITFENFNIYRPQIQENNGATKLMFPQEARLRNFSYSAATTIDMNIKFIIRNGENLDNIELAVMQPKQTVITECLGKRLISSREARGQG